ncbi:DUF6498-containing protein [Muricoccus radiodurans]|uniref:DUF6498-containing protein n=1 Tax=Muricoccus radiodurans TaxID=2231721 RepID=UPI003CF405A0
MATPPQMQTMEAFLAGMPAAVLPQRSFWILAAANLVIAWIALTQGWFLVDVVFAYLMQRVVAGVLTFVRIARLRDFSAEGFTYGQPADEPKHKVKRAALIGFSLIYVIVHLVLFAFVTGLGDPPRWVFWSQPAQLLAAAAFLLPLFLAGQRTAGERDARPMIGGMMLTPLYGAIPLILAVMILDFFPENLGILLFLMVKLGIEGVCVAILTYEGEERARTGGAGSRPRRAARKA